MSNALQSAWNEAINILKILKEMSPLTGLLAGYGVFLACMTPVVWSLAAPETIQPKTANLLAKIGNGALLCAIDGTTVRFLNLSREEMGPNITPMVNAAVASGDCWGEQMQIPQNSKEEAGLIANTRSGSLVCDIDSVTTRFPNKTLDEIDPSLRPLIAAEIASGNCWRELSNLPPQPKGRPANSLQVKPQNG